jgi:hypothetical protein
MDDKKAISPVIADRHVDERILSHSHDADVALQALQASEGQLVTIDAATNKRLLRIIDWHLMPLMCVVYGLNYLDSMSVLYLFGVCEVLIARNNHLVCKHHGPGDGPASRRERVPVAGEHVLLWYVISSYTCRSSELMA